MEEKKKGFKMVNKELKEIPIPSHMANPDWNFEKEEWYEKQDERLLKIYERIMVDLIDVINRYKIIGKDVSEFERDLESYREKYKKTKDFIEKNQ